MREMEVMSQLCDEIPVCGWLGGAAITLYMGIGTSLIDSRIGRNSFSYKYRDLVGARRSSYRGGWQTLQGPYLLFASERSMEMRD